MRLPGSVPLVGGGAEWWRGAGLGAVLQRKGTNLGGCNTACYPVHVLFPIYFCECRESLGTRLYSTIHVCIHKIQVHYL